MKSIELLKKMRAASGEKSTTGLSDPIIERFAALDPNLGEAIETAYALFEELRSCFDFSTSESSMIEYLQEDFVNFYSAEATNPYVALAAQGPWIVTAHGAVVHDNGGYGMLGFGHNPKPVIKAMGQAQVMANIMTASLSQKRFSARFFQELGQRWQGQGRPFAKLICMNSGSESVTVAGRISDVNACSLTDKGGRHAGKEIYFLSLAGGFHGRTDRPAQASDSSLKKYQVLASFRDRKNLHTVIPNDEKSLRDAFAWAEKNNVFFEMFLMEPVMGEGNPGEALRPEWYELACQLTHAHGALVLVDSIQAGLRAHGCLSIVDYPGFEKCTPPDLETYSKALNAGQYPLSVLALGERAAALYRRGIYGNTMTTNPRSLDVAIAVLDLVTPELRKNITDRGHEFVEKLTKLQAEFPDVIEKVQGTGLLCSAFINKEKFLVEGKGQLEEYLRRNGIGVIHGGANALRFTPHFRLTSAEIDLIIENMRLAFVKGPAIGVQKPIEKTPAKQQRQTVTTGT